MERPQAGQATSVIGFTLMMATPAGHARLGRRDAIFAQRHNKTFGSMTKTARLPQQLQRTVNGQP